MFSVKGLPSFRMRQPNLYLCRSHQRPRVRKQVSTSSRIILPRSHICYIFHSAHAASELFEDDEDVEYTGRAGTGDSEQEDDKEDSGVDFADKDLCGSSDEEDDRDSGVYKAGHELTRGLPVLVPASFLNAGGTTCTH